MTITLSNSQPTTVGPGSLFIGTSDLQAPGVGYITEITVVDPVTGRLVIAGQTDTFGTGNWGVVLGVDEAGAFVQPGNLTLADGSGVTVTVSVLPLAGGPTTDTLVLPPLSWSPAGDLARVMSLLGSQIQNDYVSLLGLILGGSVGGKLDSILSAVTFTAH